MKPKYFITFIGISLIILLIGYAMPKNYGVDLVYICGILVGMTLTLGNYE